MTDRPIIFSAPMVRALLAGRKTQTRRVLSLRRYRGFTEFGPSDTAGYDWHFRRADGCWCDVTDARLQELLPYAVGDQLYVREAWNCFSFSQDGEVAWPAKRIPTKSEFDELHELGVRGDWQLVYAESERAREHFADQKWRPSIHMPRWASRLTLTVTDVRVQRLQAISEADALAEGIVEHEATMTDPAEYTIGPDSELYFSAADAYQSLWNSLHGTGAWDENPWVVALSFTVEQGNIDALGGAA